MHELVIGLFIKRQFDLQILLNHLFGTLPQSFDVNLSFNGGFLLAHLPGGYEVIL